MNFEDFTRNLDHQQLTDLKKHVDGVTEARRKKISIESIKVGMSPQQAADVRAEIARVLRETQS